MIRTSSALIVFFGLVVPGLAHAQDQKPESDTQATSQRFEQDALDLDAGGGFVIIGKEHLPDFTVLIDREDLSKAYDLELDERFLPKIIEAVGKEPF